MRELLQKLQLRHPDIVFELWEQFMWSFLDKKIVYCNTIAPEVASWSLLHEVGHADLEHQSYSSDVELLRKEVEAWAQARLIAIDLGIKIPSDHIELCVNSYRDWLYKRSICPACTAQGVQKTPNLYACINCGRSWRITSERFHRSYRQVCAI